MLERALDQTGASQVTLSGGEPLLRDNLVELVRFLNTQEVAVNLITNGSRLDAGAIALLAGSVRVFQLPLHSADRLPHDRMSGRIGAFDAVTRAIAELKVAGVDVEGLFVATRWNLPSWPETLGLPVPSGEFRSEQATPTDMKMNSAATSKCFITSPVLQNCKN